MASEVSPGVKLQIESNQTHLPAMSPDADPDAVAHQRFLKMLAAHRMGIHGTADTLGSPVSSGQLGNGPGVGYSGAGTNPKGWGQPVV